MVSSLFAVDEKQYEALVIKESEKYIPASGASDPSSDPSGAHGSSQLPIAVSRQKKETRLAPSDLSLIQKLAAVKGSEDERQKKRVELYHEKLALHNVSKERVTGWDNTIRGARRRRLQAYHESRAEIERQRQVQDKEWATFRKNERETLLARAKTLQTHQTPLYKTLHSQLLLSHVLHERDRQIEYKTKRQILEKISDRTFQLNERLKTLAEIENERIGVEKKHRARIAEAKDGQRVLQDKKQREMEAIKQERQELEKAIKKESLQEKENALLRRQQKQIRAQKQRHILASQIAERRALSLTEDQEESELEATNQAFSEMKEWVETKKKELMSKDLGERQQRSESIAEQVLEANVKQEKRVDDFISVTLKSHDGDYQKRITAEKAKQDQYLAEQKKFLELRKTILAQRQDVLQKEKQADASLMRKEVERYEKEKEDVEQKRRLKLHQVKEFNDKLVTERANMRAKLKVTKGEQEALEKAQQDLDTHTFEAYAQSCIQEWAKAGRNVKPIQDWLGKQKPHRKDSLKLPSIGNSSTYERLGFSVPWSPVLPSTSHVGSK